MIWMWDAVYGALKPQPWFYSITQTQPYPQFPPNPPPPSETYQCKGVPTCPSTVYQGAKTHCTYISYGCGMLFMGLWSLNHDFTTWLTLSITPNFPKIHPHLQRRISVVRVHPHVNPQHIRVLKHIVYIKWMWGAVYRGLEGPPTDKTIKENPPKCILASKMPVSRGILARSWTHLLIHSISGC